MKIRERNKGIKRKDKFYVEKYSCGSEEDVKTRVSWTCQSISISIPKACDPKMDFGNFSHTNTWTESAGHGGSTVEVPLQSHHLCGGYVFDLLANKTNLLISFLFFQNFSYIFCFCSDHDSRKIFIERIQYD